MVLYGVITNVVRSRLMQAGRVTLTTLAAMVRAASDPRRPVGHLRHRATPSTTVILSDGDGQLCDLTQWRYFGGDGNNMYNDLHANEPCRLQTTSCSGGTAANASITGTGSPPLTPFADSRGGRHAPNTAAKPDLHVDFVRFEMVRTWGPAGDRQCVMYEHGNRNNDRGNL